MKIKKKTFKGKTLFWGRGTADEVETLNTEKSFSAALDALSKIRKTRRTFFASHNESSRVDRGICGKRKISRERKKIFSIAKMI